jgi:ABC-type glycerol-3-phosphate transport system substrate-binding protein
MKKKWTLRVLAGVLALAVFYAGWWLLPSRVEPVNVRPWLMPKRAQWEGVLTVWQVSSWRTAKGARDYLLQQAARRVEKANRGLYFEVESISEETLLARLAAGKMPDILSFPSGMEVPFRDLCMGLTYEGALLPALEAAVADEGEAWALPWMASGSLVAVNTGLAQDYGVLPDADNWTAQSLLEAAQAAYHVVGTKNPKTIYGLSGAQQNLLPLAQQETGLGEWMSPTQATDRAAYDQFAEGKAVFLLATPWEAAAMGRSQSRGKGFPVTLLPIPSDMPMELTAQWVCVRDSDNDRRDSMAALLVTALLSETTQKQVTTSTGCLSVWAGQDANAQPDAAQKLLLTRQGVVWVRKPGWAVPDETVDAAARGDGSARLSLAQGCVVWQGGAVDAGPA